LEHEENQWVSYGFGIGAFGFRGYGSRRSSGVLAAGKDQLESF
jgi:hypothetical protein